MFEWDPRKARINLEKHGVTFEEAMTIFSDEQALDWIDPDHSAAEARSKRLGRSLLDHVLLVVYTVRRTEHGEEKIRIISARFASRKERRAYQG